WKAMDMRRFFRVNSDLMLRSACIMAVLFAMTTFAGRMGDSVLARNAVLMQFFMFFSYFMDGFAYAGEALCGRFAGASDPSGIYRTVKGLMIWAVIMTVVFTAVYFFFLTPVTALLTDEASVINGVSSLKWVAVGIPVISAAAFIFDGVYIGMTATSRLLLATLAAMILFFLTMLPYLLGRDLMILPDRLLWCAFLIFLLPRGVSLAILLPSTLRRIVSPADHR
ncbi:MAG: MATE family efflux transporter, partial [Muribaculaceae bacterium]|nr:MATE family efflux transporter [Muribaculaceae bacterium]